MKRPGFVVILSIAGGASLIAAILCGIAIAVTLANAQQTGRLDVSALLVFVASAVQSLVSYAVCSALVWLIDAHCKMTPMTIESQPDGDELTDKFGRPVKRKSRP